MAVKKGVLKSFTIFTGKHLLWTLAFNFIKKTLQHRCFPVNTANFLRTSILKNIWEGLLLDNWDYIFSVWRGAQCSILFYLWKGSVNKNNSKYPSHLPRNVAQKIILGSWENSVAFFKKSKPVYLNFWTEVITSPYPSFYSGTSAFTLVALPL